MQYGLTFTSHRPPQPRCRVCLVITCTSSLALMHLIKTRHFSISPLTKMTFAISETCEASNHGRRHQVMKFGQLQPQYHSRTWMLSALVFHLCHDWYYDYLSISRDGERWLVCLLSIIVNGSLTANVDPRRWYNIQDR